MRLTAACLLAAVSSATASDQFPQTIPAPGGEVVIANAVERDFLYGEWHFAPVRRAGDTVYLSGVVAGPRKGEAHTPEAFKVQLRRAFASLDASLQAAGLTFADVAELETFHVFSSPNFDGTKAQHLDAFRAVKDEYFKAPYPAWTAIGVAALVPDNGLVEIKLTAHARRK
ncbi:MAG: RidA family protein [Alphaproteobacteria bacterium]|nr:RidA family protein [Alphaproteobacteria bacterium]